MQGLKRITAQKFGPLLPFLIENISSEGRNKIKKLLSLGSISVNGNVVTRHDHALRPGDIVLVRTDKTAQSEKQFLKKTLHILLEDDHIIAVTKPAGLLTISTESVQKQTAYFQVNHYLNCEKRRKEKEIFVVHRLDRETSGILLFAKTFDAKTALQTGWETAEKHYYAVVEGTPAKKSGRVENYLRENKYMSVYAAKADEPDAKRALTEYNVLKTNGPYSLLDVKIDTGRKHQIRVHLSGLGHPIIGDDRYGAKTNPAGRLGLHAFALAFDHPASGKRVQLQTALPEALKALFKEKAAPPPA